MNKHCQENVGASLQLVARANIGIRTVIDISRRVNLVAVNASLAAKRAGVQARGFGVVSAELRRFSRWLDEQMAELDRLIAILVLNLAGVAKERHRLRHMQQACRNVGKGSTLEVGVGLVEKRLKCADVANQALWNDLGIRIGLLLHLCGKGTTLARLAKVEAVSGGAFVSGLRQVADEVGAAIESIIETLACLSHDMVRAQR